MITMTMDAKDLIKGIGIKAPQLVKTEIHKTLRQQGESGKRYAKMLAPVGKTKALRRGIYYTATPTNLQINSTVPGSFPYNKWVNQDPGFVSLGPYRRANVRFGIRPGQTLVYGQLPTHWRWTGTPGYMNHTYWRLKKNFPLALKRNLKKLGEL